MNLNLSYLYFEQWTHWFGPYSMFVRFFFLFILFLHRMKIFCEAVGFCCCSHFAFSVWQWRTSTQLLYYSSTRTTGINVYQFGYFGRANHGIEFIGLDAKRETISVRALRIFRVAQCETLFFCCKKKNCSLMHPHTTLIFIYGMLQVPLIVQPVRSSEFWEILYDSIVRNFSFTFRCFRFDWPKKRILKFKRSTIYHTRVNVNTGGSFVDLEWFAAIINCSEWTTMFKHCHNAIAARTEWEQK